jgi:hypothetical protein
MERSLKIVTLAACISLHASSAELPNTQGTGAVSWTGTTKNAAQSEVVAILAWGERAMFTNIQRQTTFIRRVATEAERRLAEQRAAAYYAKLSPPQRAEIKKKKRYWAVPVTKAKAAAKPTPKLPGKKPGEGPVASPTPTAAEEEDIMIYDPLAGSLVNKYVYTIKNAPPSDTAISLDGYEPLLYVGR